MIKLTKAKTERDQPAKARRVKTKTTKSALAKSKPVNIKPVKPKPVKINLVKKRSHKEIVAQIAAENRAHFDCLDPEALADKNKASDQSGVAVHYSFSIICRHCGGTVLFNPESQGLVCGCPHCSNELVLSTQETTGTSVEEIEAQVRSHIATQLAQNHSTKSVHVVGLKLFPVGGIHYKGAIELKADGQLAAAEIVVDYDKESFSWKILAQPDEPTPNQYQEAEPEAENNSTAELALSVVEIAFKCLGG